LAPGNKKRINQAKNSLHVAGASNMLTH